MKLTTKLMAIGAVAVLAVAGLAAVLMTSSTASATNDGTPMITVGDEGSATDPSNLSIQVCSRVNGQDVPMVGANVTICEMNIVREQERTAMTVMNTIRGQTDGNGTVTFERPEGKYWMFAERNGLKGFSHGNLSDDEMNIVKMHQWNWGQMKGETFQVMNQAQTQTGNQICGQNGTCDLTQDRTQSRDRLSDGSGDQDQLRQQSRDQACK